MLKLAEEETAENSPPPQRRLPFPPSTGCGAGLERALPPPPGRGGRILPSEHRRGRLQSERLFSSRYLEGGGRGGGLEAANSQRAARSFPQSSSGPHPTHAHPAASLLVPIAFSRRICRNPNVCYARQQLNALPRAVTKLSSPSWLRQVPPHSFSYPSACFPSAPGPTCPAGQKRSVSGAGTWWSPGLGRKGRPREPEGRQKQPLATGPFWVPSTRGHQKPPESRAPTRPGGCVVILSIKPTNKHSPLIILSNPNYLPAPRTSGSSRQHPCFSGSYTSSSSLLNFPLPTSLKLVSRQLDFGTPLPRAAAPDSPVSP